MKIVVVGGTGLIGSKVVNGLSGRGHEVMPASPPGVTSSWSGSCG